MDSGTATPQGGGLPHSEIHGSKGARPSPQLFAACHVLHRLSVPRHPPNALRRLISAADKTAQRAWNTSPQASRRSIPQQSLPEQFSHQGSGIRDQMIHEPTPRPNRSGHLPLHNVQYPCGQAPSAPTAIFLSYSGPFRERSSVIRDHKQYPP